MNELQVQEVLCVLAAKKTIVLLFFFLFFNFFFFIMISSFLASLESNFISFGNHLLSIKRIQDVLF